MRTRLVKALMAAMTIAACGSSDDDGSPVTQAPPAAGPTAVPALVDVVEIDQLDVLQGTSATLVAEAARVEKPNAPIIAGRPGLVRVHVRTLDKKTKMTPLTAELHVVTPGKPDVVVSDGPRTLGKMIPGELKTTFNFDLDETAITGETKLTVTVRDPKNPADPGVQLLGGDALPLKAKERGTKLRVEFVPIRYDADGSGRLSPLDDKAVESYKRALYKLYPIREVEARVRTEELAWTIPVDPRGSGWNQLLSAVMGLRRDDGVDEDVYYVGVFAPAKSINEYCKGGCILGVAPAQIFADIGLRTAMVVGFADKPASDGTLAQELAHALGRAHAPCGVSEFVDEKYPYFNATLGVAGYDILAKELIDPDGRRFDFMSYCGPVWTSDWTFSGISTALEEVVTTAAPSRDHLRDRVRAFLVSTDGEMTLGPNVEVAHEGAALDDEGTTVRYEDAHGKTLAVSRAGWRPLSGPGGGVLLAKDAPAGAVRVRVEGRAVRARELAPRLGERPLLRQ